MLLGIVLTFAIRNVPSKFNEGKLIALSVRSSSLLLCSVCLISFSRLKMGRCKNRKKKDTRKERTSNHSALTSIHIKHHHQSSSIIQQIYNITLLGIILIPVFLVLRYIIPFVAWIIRTSVIIYVFTATLWLQFLPKVWGVIFTDKLKDPPMQMSADSAGSVGSLADTKI